jgi:hypothetical protein
MIAVVLAALALGVWMRVTRFKPPEVNEVVVPPVGDPRYQRPPE